MAVDIDPILKEFSAVKIRRAPWEPVWELIARYMYQRKQGFTTVGSPGDFYNHDDVMNNVAGESLQSMISSIDGALWKNGGRTFRIKPPRQIRVTDEIKEFYKEINSRKDYQMEHEKAAFGTARMEAFGDGAAFGTDGIGVFPAPKGSEHKVEYKAMSLKSLYVVEDAKGRVYKEFYETEFTAFQLIDEYGEVARTDKVKALLEVNNHETKMKVLWVVRPRGDYSPAGSGQQVFSYESIHILEDEKVVLREAGFSGNAIVVSRFYKNEGEEYGRSAGFNALDPTISINAVDELLAKGFELSAFPSWYVLDDGTLGNGVIDRSAAGVIPIDATSSKITGLAPIGQIGNVGDLNGALKLRDALVLEIRGHFFVDKLTDLNNKTRMTLGEAQIRNELRAESVGSIFSRQIEEKLTPVIRRTIKILEEAGEFGVESNSTQHVMLKAEGKEPLLIPVELVTLRTQGIEIYQIEYISPAARILRSEELRGVISVWQFAAAFGAISPELGLRIDKKRSMELVQDLYGASGDILLSEDKYEEALKAFQESQAMMMQARMTALAADVKAKEASANQQNAQADATAGGMNGLLNGGGAGYPAMAM